jgi:hypothetical protein
MATTEHKAVLVLPDVGLNDKQIASVKEEFRNSLVSSLNRAGATHVVIVIEIVIVYRPLA